MTDTPDLDLSLQKTRRLIEELAKVNRELERLSTTLWLIRDRVADLQRELLKDLPDER